MDGVITSEEAYWNAAGLVVRDVLESPAFLGLNPNVYSPIVNLFYQRLADNGRNAWRAYLPTELIRECKARGINSNWDLAYLGLGLYLAPLAAPVLNALRYSLPSKAASAKETQKTTQDISSLNPYSRALLGDRTVPHMRECLSPAWDRMRERVEKQAYGDTIRADELHLWGAYLRDLKQTIFPDAYPGLTVFESFSETATGPQLLEELNFFTEEQTIQRVPWFGRRSQLWEDCRDLFQQWYLGESLYSETYNRSVAYGPKPGLIHREEPLHDLNTTHAVLSSLAKAGYTLGIATGRPRKEIVAPLQRWGVFKYFDQDRIATHDEIEQAEQALGENDANPLLGKPHPYVFLKAAFPDSSPAELVSMAKEGVPHPEEIAVVGDAQADIWAAQTMGFQSVAVLTGAAGLDGETILKEANPSVIYEDICEFSEALVASKIIWDKI